MRVAIGLVLLASVAAAIGLSLRYYLGKRREVCLRGTKYRGRINIPLAPKE